jgi:molybdenum cofactor biosynthesis enzyme
MSEIGRIDRWAGSEHLPPIHGLLARCELRISTHAFTHLSDPRFHAGKACVLARAAGVRAARWLGEIVDAHAETAIGPVELEWGPQRGVGVVWQAHVSTAQGAFSPTGSMIAATTAAVAMIDLVRSLDEGAHVTGASVVDEPWMFGQDDAESTIAF